MTCIPLPIPTPPSGPTHLVVCVWFIVIIVAVLIGGLVACLVVVAVYNRVQTAVVIVDVSATNDLSAAVDLYGQPGCGVRFPPARKHVPD